VSEASPDLSSSEVIWRLLAVLAIVGVNAFFVASEFALVSSRRSKIDALAKRGDVRSRAVQRVQSDLTRYLSTTQLGITIASLALGWVGEATIASLLRDALHHLGLDASPAVTHGAATVTTAFILITMLHIVLGELTPKAIAIRDPERMSRRIVYPLRVLAWVATPFTVLLNASANGVLRLLRVPPANAHSAVHSPEELELIVRQSLEAGNFSETDREVLEGVFVFQKKKARDVMRPRTKVTAIPLDATREEVRETIRAEGYSRYPVYGETPDDVVGVLRARTFFLADGPAPFSVAALMDKEPLYVPDGRAADLVLADLRHAKQHMAIVLDEYGGMQGVVTLEDLVQELVGDIADERERARPDYTSAGGQLELSGDLSIIDVRQDHQVEIPDGSWTTIGGYVFTLLGRVPRVGDRVRYPGGELEVVAMERKRVAAVRVHRAPAPAAEPA